MSKAAPRSNAPRSFNLTVLPGRFAVCRLAPVSPLPAWLPDTGFRALVWTEEECSVVCLQEGVPEGVACERNRVCLKVEGPLAFTEIGVLAALAGILADAGISLLALSTFDTDYLLVQDDDWPRTRAALLQAGHHLQG